MSTYTVFALTNTDDPDAFLVAGVVEGDHPAVDSDPYEEPWCRYATVVEAASPAEAEEQANEQFHVDNGHAR